MIRVVVESLLGLMALTGAVTLALVVVLAGLFFISILEGLLGRNTPAKRVAATIVGAAVTAGLLVLIWQVGRLMLR